MIIKFLPIELLKEISNLEKKRATSAKTISGTLVIIALNEASKFTNIYYHS